MEWINFNEEMTIGNSCYSMNLYPGYEVLKINFPPI